MDTLIMQAAWAQALAATGPADAAGAGSAVQVHSVWDFLIKGGPVMVPILLCSLAALTVIVERCLVLRRQRVIPPDFLAGVQAAFADGAAAAVAYCAAHASPLANVFHAGLKRLAAPAERRNEAMAEAGAREIFILRRRLRLLAVIAALAPLLGLLGTVFGMINAFQTVALSGEALGKTELLAKGIYEALITTAAGLLLAIPVMICHHALAGRVEQHIHDIDRIAVDFFDDLDLPIAAAPVSSHSETRLGGDGDGRLAGALVAARA